jgi:hypothetical protein
MAVHKCCKAETVRSSRSDFSKRHLYTSSSQCYLPGTLFAYTVKKTGSFLSKLSKDNRKRYSDIARKVAVKRQIKDKQKRKEVSGERLRLQNLTMIAFKFARSFSVPNFIFFLEF